MLKKNHIKINLLSFLVSVTVLVYLQIYINAVGKNAFWDMETILTFHPRCFAEWGIKTFVNVAPNTNFQDGCSGLNYGLLSMPLYQGMASISTDPFIWVMALTATILYLTFFISTKTFSNSIFSIFVFFSPPFILLIKTGNPDLINLIGVMILGIFLFRNQTFAFVILASLITLHKFYGLVFFIIYVLLFLNRSSLLIKIKYLIVALLTFSILVYQFLFLGVRKFTDAASNHYGIAIWDNYLRKVSIDLDESLVRVIGLLSLIYLAQKLLKFQKKDGSPESPTVQFYVSFLCYLVFVFSYILVNNVDYRLTFLIFAIYFDFNHYFQRAKIPFLILFFVSIYASYPVTNLKFMSIVPVQVFGDVTLHILVSYLIVRIARMSFVILKDAKLV